MKSLTQAQCTRIATELNNQPRERLGFRTPAEALRRAGGVALQSRVQAALQRQCRWCGLRWNAQKAALRGAESVIS